MSTSTKHQKAHEPEQCQRAVLCAPRSVRTYYTTAVAFVFAWKETRALAAIAVE